MGSGCITSVGLTAFLNAQMNGTVFTPNVVQISSSISACTGEETFLPDIVYTAPSSSVVQLSPSQDLFRTILTLDTTVGNFTIGTIGLSTPDGILYALGAFPGAGCILCRYFFNIY
jgi:hypothetical protein